MKFCFMRFPEGRQKALTLSYDDGSKFDKNLIEIANKYGIKVTLNINSAYIGGNDNWHLNAEELKALVEDGGHEIAVHGARHIAPGSLLPAAGINEVLEGRRAIERYFGTTIRGMAYPNNGIHIIYSGVPKEEIKDYIRQTGIAYARTLAGDNDKFEIPTDFYEWFPTAYHINPKLMEWLDKFLVAEKVRSVPLLFYLWGHSYEFDRDKNWELLEEFCSKAGNKDNIWYATNIEICDYINAYRSLIFNVDNTMVFNPTCRELWFETDAKKIVSVAPGECKNI